MAPAGGGLKGGDPPPIIFWQAPSFGKIWSVKDIHSVEKKTYDDGNKMHYSKLKFRSNKNVYILIDNMPKDMT